MAGDARLQVTFHLFLLSVWKNSTHFCKISFLGLAKLIREITVYLYSMHENVGPLFSNFQYLC